MNMALKQAQEAFDDDEVPVGCVIVYEDKVIAKAYNQVERLKDPTAHAEMIAITQASSFLKSKWLYGARLYVTIEPCPMCCGALILSRIDSVIFGAEDIKTGALGSKLNLNSLGLNHKIKVKQGLLKEDCSNLISDFFKKQRSLKKEKNLKANGQ